MTSQVTAVARPVGAQRAGQPGPGHGRATFAAGLLRAVLEVVDRPVLIAARLAALLGHVLATRLRVGDPGGLLLAGAVLAQLLVELVVLDARSVVLGHVPGLPREPGLMRPRGQAAAARAAATASWSARSLSTLCACSAPVSCPLTQCQRTSAWRAISASRAMTRSWFLTGDPDAVFHPFFFHPWIHLVMESSSSVESVTMHTVAPAASERRPCSAAVYSIRLLVVSGSLPLSSTGSAPPGPQTIAAQPPGPGLPLHAPSVQTRASPGRACTGTSGARGALGRRRRYAGAEDGIGAGC